MGWLCCVVCVCLFEKSVKVIETKEEKTEENIKFLQVKNI